MSDIIVCKVPVSAECPSGVKFVIPSPNVSLKTALGSIPSDTISHWVESRDNVPQDRYFRNAWSASTDAKKVLVDMAKAKAVHVEKLREVRNEKLSQLDTEFMRAIEAKDVAKQNAISAKKQALRDMPLDPGFDRHSTPDALKAFVPESLK